MLMIANIVFEVAIFTAIIIGLIILFTFGIRLINIILPFINSRIPYYDIPLITVKGKNTPALRQTILNPLYIICLTFICISFLPMSSSEKILLDNEESWSIIQLPQKVLQIGVRLQLYAFPITINAFKQLSFNPWLPHDGDDTKLKKHMDLVEKSYKKNRLLTPVYNSVAWHSLVLANNSVLSPKLVRRYHSMFGLYNTHSKYKEKAEYSKRFLNNNIKM